MYPQLSKCPVCGEDLMVTRLHCRHCDTTLEGHFSQVTGPFSQLSQNQQDFVLAFVRCEGRFTRLEEELNLSYPTLRNRLNEVIRDLGLNRARMKRRKFLLLRCAVRSWMNWLREISHQWKRSASCAVRRIRKR